MNEVTNEGAYYKYPKQIQDFIDYATECGLKFDVIEETYDGERAVTVKATRFEGEQTEGTCVAATLSRYSKKWSVRAYEQAPGIGIFRITNKQVRNSLSSLSRKAGA